MTDDPMIDRPAVLSWAELRTNGGFRMRYQPPKDLETRLMLITDQSDPAEPHVVVRWIDVTGIVLVPPTPVDVLQTWNGQIAVAGYVDRLHIRQLAEVEYTIAEVVGRALPIAAHTIATLADLRAGRLSIVNDRASLATDTDEYSYPVLLDPDSTFAMLAQDALVSGLAINLTGMLAEAAEMAALACGLLLRPHALTIFSAG